MAALKEHAGERTRQGAGRGAEANGQARERGAAEAALLARRILVERVHQLRVSLERCQERVKYCERQLSDFVKSADLSDPRQQRCWKKLGSDLERAENDVRWIQKQLDELMD
jgi:hypothetical protein